MQSNLDDIGGAKELALHRLEVAYEDLTSAKRNYKESDYRTANNRAYYSIYHGICACMALRFESYKSHSQTLGAFNKNYVHKGLFPKDIGRRISRAEEIRHESDYNDFYVVAKEETAMQIDTAEEFLSLVKLFLEKQIEETS